MQSSITENSKKTFYSFEEDVIDAGSGFVRKEFCEKTFGTDESCSPEGKGTKIVCTLSRKLTVSYNTASEIR